MDIIEIIKNITNECEPNKFANQLMIKIERQLGYELPELFKEIYSEFNGGILFGCYFLSLDEIISEIINFEELEQYDEFCGTVNSKGTILKKSYTSKRIPFITDASGNFIGIDFKPGPKGIKGQIINFGRDEDTMYVLSNSFKDFIEGISKLPDSGNIYITDYMIKNKINFIKEVDESLIPNKIKSPKLKKLEATEDKVKENSYKIIINDKMPKDIISILENMIANIKRDINVIKYKEVWFDCRIKNIKDSLSRTMSGPKNFFEVLESKTIAKEEIKGYSFSIYFEIENQIDRNNAIYGKEMLFVDIDKDKVLIRLRDRINDKNFQEAYERICEYFK